MKHIPPLPLVDFMSFQDLEESRPVVLVTNGPAWQAVKNFLNLTIAIHLDIREATLAAWEAQLTRLASLPRMADLPAVVYAVGGGLAVDAGKYFASKLDLPMVCLPTALSVDAFFTWASGIRQDGCVHYIETKTPERVILDFEVIAAAPAAIRAAGITDVISIATGAWDWHFAHQNGKNPAGMDFIPWVYANAQSILNGVLDCAQAAGAGDWEGLKTLYDCLAMEVQLCNQIGHARPEEGSEHYFAYSVENMVGPGLPHGNLVGPGILIMAGIQGQETSRLEKALQACHIPLHTIPEMVIQSVLEQLPGYVQHHNLAYGIAHELGTILTAG